MIVIAGASGAGKSTLARQMNLPCIALDQFRTGRPHTREDEWQKFFQAILASPEETLVVDSVALRTSERLPLLRAARESGRKTEIVVLCATVEECLSAQRERTRPTSEVVVRAMVEACDALTQEELEREGWERITFTRRSQDQERTSHSAR